MSMISIAAIRIAQTSAELSISAFQSENTIETAQTCLRAHERRWRGAVISSYGRHQHFQSSGQVSGADAIQLLMQIRQGGQLLATARAQTTNSQLFKSRLQTIYRVQN